LHHQKIIRIADSFNNPFHYTDFWLGKSKLMIYRAKIFMHMWRIGQLQECNPSATCTTVARAEDSLAKIASLCSLFSLAMVEKAKNSLHRTIQYLSRPIEPRQTNLLGFDLPLLFIHLQ
jgi:hypothetical protein